MIAVYVVILVGVVALCLWLTHRNENDPPFRTVWVLVALTGLFALAVVLL